MADRLCVMSWCLTNMLYLNGDWYYLDCVPWVCYRRKQAESHSNDVVEEETHGMSKTSKKFKPQVDC